MLQSTADGASPEELASLDAEITALRTQISTAQLTLKALKAQLNNLQSTLSTADLMARASALTSERKEVLARLTLLRAGSVRPVNPEELEGVEKELKCWEGVVKRRERIEKELWDTMRDGLPEGTNVTEFRERLGLDE